MTAARRLLTGRLQVALPPAEAFRLFTPRGEQDWAPGWQPQFPEPDGDDAEPGTVFETDAHGHRTVWVVTSSERGRHISYARVTPGEQAGTVSVDITAAGGGSEVTVSYHLTALTAAACGRLRDFSDGYLAYLASWEDAITAVLANPDRFMARG